MGLRNSLGLLAISTGLWLVAAVHGALAQPPSGAPAAPPEGTAPAPSTTAPPAAPSSAAPSGAPGGPGQKPPPVKLVVLSALGGPSAKAAKPSADPHDLNGTYIGKRLPGGPDFSGRGVTYTPAAAALVKKRQEMRAHNISVQNPSFSCRPFSNTLASELFPMRIIQTAKRIVILNEEGRGVWEIFLDRTHPANMTPTYNGDSVGHWEGDTLVVDTAGFNGKQWLDMMSGPQSVATHSVTRIRKIDGGKQLEVSSELTDPATFVGVKRSQSVVMWNPELHLLEFDCEAGLPIGYHPGVVAQ